MMKQYMAIKERYPDCLLFFRLGDFYELFLNDAKIGSEVLGITLTGRPKGKDGRIPMAGVPYHAVDSYLNKLVKAGYKVAICEQLSEPDKKGIVERDVIRVVTPGTVMDERALEKKEHNYILALTIEGSTVAIALSDLSTGELKTEEYITDNWQDLLRDELTRIHPTECILPPKLYNNPEALKFLKTIKDMTIFLFPSWDSLVRNSEEGLKTHFGVKTLAAYEIDTKKSAQKACFALLSYLKDTQKSSLPHINKITIFSADDYVHLDRATILNLELFSTIRERDTKGSFLTAIDCTETAMGGRLLREWITHPLQNKKHIEERLTSVEEFLHNAVTCKRILKNIEDITDVERTFSRVSVGIGNARDLVSLKIAIRKILSVKHGLIDTHSLLLQKLQKNISPKLQDLVQLIEQTIDEDPPIHLKEGGILKSAVDPRLDELRAIILKGKQWISAHEEEERQKTGITSLKIRYNQVFGYFIEISKSNLSAVPTHYFRKQTLVNGERFITPELKIQEQIILEAESEVKTREYELYKEIVAKTITFAELIQKAAQATAILDCILSFTKLAKRGRYTKPTIVYSHEMEIQDGRHPVVEELLPPGTFVPNTINIGSPKQSLLLITGPNMAGKSVFLRQVALITLLAHMGSYVPAKKAHIPLVDSIFVRSGASDVITSGLSTFMVEMVETAFILNHATDKSLIIMDEIGRGTSTYDGVSIAWSVAEYLVKQFTHPPKTLFATHYHELTALEKEYPKHITNAHMEVTKKKELPVFSHTLLKGPTFESYGVLVAKLAGLPQPIINRSNELLLRFAETETNTQNEGESDTKHAKIMRDLLSYDVDRMTPLTALTKLKELQDKAQHYE